MTKISGNDGSETCDSSKLIVAGYSCWQSVCLEYVIRAIRVWKG
jgi:hypothetical protein